MDNCLISTDKFTKKLVTGQLSIEEIREFINREDLDIYSKLLILKNIDDFYLYAAAIECILGSLNTKDNIVIFYVYLKPGFRRSVYSKIRDKIFFSIIGSANI